MRAPEYSVDPVTHMAAAGPVAESVKNETAQISNELSSLANARTDPSYTAANDQNLTRKNTEQYEWYSD